MKQHVLTLVTLAFLSTSSMAKDLTPFEVYEHMKTSLAGDWVLSPKETLVLALPSKKTYFQILKNRWLPCTTVMTT